MTKNDFDICCLTADKPFGCHILCRNAKFASLSGNSWKLEAGSWKQEVGSKKLEAGSRKLLVNGYWLMAYGYWLTAYGYWLTATGLRLPATGLGKTKFCGFNDWRQLYRNGEDPASFVKKKLVQPLEFDLVAKVRIVPKKNRMSLPNR